MAVGLAADLMMATAPELSSYRKDRRIRIAVCIFLTAIVWLVFAQTLRHEFINFDDNVYVYDNTEVSRGLTVEGLKWLVTHSHAHLWHPLTTLSHMLDCQFYGLRPGGHHFTNVLLHNLAAVLLFLVLAEMTGSLWVSAFVAAIFAIHPMRVESVAWVAERKDVLSAVFFMLTVGAYARYAQAPNAARYIIMSILLACGLMSKATFVTVPLVLLLLDYWPLRRWRSLQDWRKLIVEKIPLFALSAVAALITVYVQTVTMASLEQLPLLARIKNAAVSIVAYLRQTFWPTDLAILYPHPHDQLNTVVVIASTLLIVAITLAAILLRQTRPYLFVGWFWFLTLLFPVLGIFQAGLQARADRFIYLPHIGISIAVTWTIADLTQHWRNQRALVSSAALCVIVVLTICAWKQTTYWRDSVSVWSRALAVTSNNQIAHQDLAAALWDRGQIAESRAHSRAAAIIHAQMAVKDYPFDIQKRDDLGVLLIQSGDVRGAIEQWETSLRIIPADGNALNNLAWVLATYPDDSIRNGERAVKLAETAVGLPGGESPMVLRTSAAAYAEGRNFSKATETAQRAADLAEKQGNSSLAETLRHEIEAYRAGTPHRESPAIQD
jgi:tetratricopeptide (TPR) repeat protein